LIRSRRFMIWTPGDVNETALCRIQLGDANHQYGGISVWPGTNVARSVQRATIPSSAMRCLRFRVQPGIKKAVSRRPCITAAHPDALRNGHRRGIERYRGLRQQSAVDRSQISKRDRCRAKNNSFKVRARADVHGTGDLPENVLGQCTTDCGRGYLRMTPKVRRRAS
jgi:hypothetical protein